MADKLIRLNGYVIVPPLNQWDEEHKDQIWSDFAYRTFGVSPTQAWTKFIGPASGILEEKYETSMRIQRWHDKGYRVKKATMEIHDE